MSPSVPVLWTLADWARAIAHLQLGHLAEETLTDKALAAQTYREILERRPEDANALKLLGRVLTQMERAVAKMREESATLAELRTMPFPEWAR